MIPGAPAYLPVAGGDQQGDAVDESQEAGTRNRRWLVPAIRDRWSAWVRASQAEGVPAADEVSRIQDERAAAYARLGKIAACSMPVIQ